MTKNERQLLTDVARRGLLFIDDGASAWTERWMRTLVDAGYVTKERKTGPFGAFGNWLHITDAGREVLGG